MVAKIVAAAPEVMVAKKSHPSRILGLRGRAARVRSRPLMLLPLAGIGQQVRNTLSGWSLYLRQPILPASLAYILLGFNAVLSPGGLMTAFLASRGLTGTAAALFRSGCALMGLSGTFVGKWLIAATGLLRTGIIASTFQAAVLGCAAFIYHLHLSSASSAVISGVPAFTWAFCLLIVLSRIGIWTFDMVVCQVFQMAVDPVEAASVSSAELALCNISELFMLGIAAVLSEPSSFGLLINISVAAVAGAALVFTGWALGKRVRLIAGGSLIAKYT